MEDYDFIDAVSSGDERTRVFQNAGVRGGGWWLVGRYGRCGVLDAVEIDSWTGHGWE